MATPPHYQKDGRVLEVASFKRAEELPRELSPMRDVERA